MQRIDLSLSFGERAARLPLDFSNPPDSFRPGQQGVRERVEFACDPFGLCLFSQVVSGDLRARCVCVRFVRLKLREQPFERALRDDGKLATTAECRADALEPRLGRLGDPNQRHSFDNADDTSSEPLRVRRREETSRARLDDRAANIDIGEVPLPSKELSKPRLIDSAAAEDDLA